MIEEQKLTRDIMGRVKTIYWGRLLARPVFELVVLLALLVLVKQLVFWQAAVLNMAHLSITGWFGYAAGAFWNTEVLVKLALVGAVVFSLRLILDLIKVPLFRSMVTR